MNEEKMKQFLEKVSILSLSLVLITSFSISSALPAMFDYYQGYSTGQVELLVSLPSFGIMAMLLLNGVLERIFPERLQLTLGLLILSISGTAPFWYQGYYFVFATRLLFGLGVGCSMPRLFRSSVNVTTARLVSKCLVFVALLR